MSERMRTRVTCVSSRECAARDFARILPRTDNFRPRRGAKGGESNEKRATELLREKRSVLSVEKCVDEDGK